MHSRSHSSTFCDRSIEIFAFLEGDLDAAEEASLEQHFGECARCREELNSQKSFLNMLGSELNLDDGLELPPDFAKVVSVHAINDVRGLNRSRELAVSASICIGFIAVVITGAAAGGYLPQGSFLLDKSQALLSATVHLLYSLAIGLSVILRSLTSGVAGGSGLFAALLLLGIPVAGLAFLYFRSGRSRNA